MLSIEIEDNPLYRTSPDTPLCHQWLHTSVPLIAYFGLVCTRCGLRSTAHDLMHARKGLINIVEPRYTPASIPIQDTRHGNLGYATLSGHLSVTEVNGVRAM